MFFEPKEHFYKAKGFGIGVKWEVPRTTVEEGRELTATLVISRAMNPTEIVRPDLKALPAFADAFSVTDVHDPPPLADAKEVRFTYKLKPRNRSVEAVPALEFYYFSPNAAPNKAFRKTMADAITISVTEPPPKPPVPMVEGDRLFQVAARFKLTDQVLMDLREAKVPEVVLGKLNPLKDRELSREEFRQEIARVLTVEETKQFQDIILNHAQVVTDQDVLNPPFLPCRWAWFAAALFGPLAAGAWYLVWRRIFPDAARLAHMRRSRAARRATDAIRRANRTPDPPATIASAVLGYLRTRFPLPESAVTPSEIGLALVEVKVPEEFAEQIADVFRACDRARFAPPGDSGAALAADAQAAVAQLEALA